MSFFRFLKTYSMKNRFENVFSILIVVKIQYIAGCKGLHVNMIFLISDNLLLYVFCRMTIVWLPARKASFLGSPTTKTI